MESFHERLKQLRIEAGLSQQAMADSLGISRSGYQMIENGRNGKKLAYIPRIAKRLGRRIDDLFPEMDGKQKDEADDKTVCADGFDGKEDEDFQGWEL